MINEIICEGIGWVFVKKLLWSGQVSDSFSNNQFELRRLLSWLWYSNSQREHSSQLLENVLGAHKETSWVWKLNQASDAAEKHIFILCIYAGTKLHSWVTFSEALNSFSYITEINKLENIKLFFLIWSQK